MKIIECQLEHGLRHRDYQRYRRYCTNRCRRIRKFLNFRLGKKTQDLTKISSQNIIRTPRQRSKSVSYKKFF